MNVAITLRVMSPVRRAREPKSGQRDCGPGLITRSVMATFELQRTTDYGRDIPTKLPSFSRDRAQRNAPTSGDS
jgi:hypothetical protein